MIKRLCWVGPVHLSQLVHLLATLSKRMLVYFICDFEKFLLSVDIVLPGYDFIWFFFWCLFIDKKLLVSIHYLSLKVHLLSCKLTTFNIHWLLTLVVLAILGVKPATILNWSAFDFSDLPETILQIILILWYSCSCCLTCCLVHFII